MLHQDHPYWVGVAENADEVGTAMLFLDDATVENGCLEVVPGSHTSGEMPRREVADFGQMEMDPERFDTKRLVPLVVPAGTVVYFGPFLVHQSQPNRTELDRRALLFSYQPAGRSPHARPPRLRGSEPSEAIGQSGVRRDVAEAPAGVAAEELVLHFGRRDHRVRADVDDDVLRQVHVEAEPMRPEKLELSTSSPGTWLSSRSKKVAPAPSTR